MNIVREVLNCRCCFIFTFILRNLLMFLKIIEYDYSTESLTFFYEYHNQELCACFHQEHWYIHTKLNLSNLLLNTAHGVIQSRNNYMNRSYNREIWILFLILIFICTWHAGDEPLGWSRSTRESTGWLYNKTKCHSFSEGCWHPAVANPFSSFSETFKGAQCFGFIYYRLLI